MMIYPQLPRFRTLVGLIPLFLAASAPPLRAALIDGLVAYMPFTGNPNDVSTNGLTASVNGATLTSDRFGNTGSAYLFGPSGTTPNTTHIVTNQNVGISGNDARTVSVWFRADSTPAYPAGHLVSWGTNTTGQVFSLAYEPWSQLDSTGTVGLPLGSGNLRLVMNASNIKYGAYLASNLALGQWNHLVVTYSTNISGTAIYLNGALLPGRFATPAEAAWSSTTPTTTLNTTNNPLWINSYLTEGHGLTGAIDDVRVYNRALSGSEVSSLYALESSSTAIDAVPDTLSRLWFIAPAIAGIVGRLRRSRTT
jgi:hypothetical protein